MKVTFAGHREIKFGNEEALKESLYKTITELIEGGADKFLLGGYGRFDMLCAYTVKSLKSKYPHIKSILVTPYINRQYDTLLYDESEYPPIENTPLKFAISERNKYMITVSDVVVCYVYKNYGGAYTSLKCAKRRKKQIVNLL